MLESLRSEKCLSMNIGAIPVVESLAHIDATLLWPHHLVPTVATASSSVYSPLFPCKEPTEMSMRISCPIVS